MKKIIKLLLIGVALVFAVVVFGLTYVTQFLPNIPVEELKIEATPERLERGKYLAHNVAQCVDCHSTRDWSKFSGPIVPGTEGKGGEVFNEELGFPGTYYAPNLTPHNLKNWSDGELFRAITAGVGKDGRALFPVMPYPNYGKMDKEDVYSIIAYLRTLPSIENEVPPSHSNFPMSVIIHLIPRKGEFSPKPAPADKVKYGAYLTNAASCIECHTPANRGRIIEEQAFSGGRFFPMHDGSRSVSANITPDKETGIGSWTEEMFIARFKAFEKGGGDQPVNPGEFNSIMPWSKYSRMTDEDLAAIYAYLKTLKPISNKVEKKFIKKQ